MAVDVGHHQLLVDELVALHQVGVARVVVDHHLVDLLQTVMVSLAEPLVFHAEPPVRIADREAALGGDRVELVGVDVLEDRRVEIEPVAAGIALDLALHGDEFGRQVGGFGGGHVVRGSEVRGRRSVSSCGGFDLESGLLSGCGSRRTGGAIRVPFGGGPIRWPGRHRRARTCTS